MPPLPASRALALAFLLGAVAAFGFAPFALWPLAPLAIAGLILLLERARSLGRAALLGWCYGLGTFCVGLNWIATAFTYQAAMPAWLGWVAVVLLSLYLACFPAAATALAWWLARRGGGSARGARLVLLLAGAWIVSELARATVFTGFAWNPLGVIWIPVLPVAWSAMLVGTYGLSGLTVLAGGLVVLATRTRPAAIALAAAAAVILVATMLVPAPAAPRPDAPLLRIVQPNIGQDTKWDPTAAARNFQRLAALTGPPGARPRIVLWPEVAVPALLEEDANARRALAALLGPRDLMLTGAEAFQYDAQGQIVSASNALFALDAGGRLLGRYDKAHLVPYGEYLPMRPLLSRLGLSRLAPGDVDFRPGPGPGNVALPGIGPVGIQICYEIIFSGHVVSRAERPRFLFNPSNDAWFGRWGPPQHLAQARLRAIEEGLPIIRSTPTGISAVIDARGRLLAALPWRTAGVIQRPLPPSDPATPFSRLGNLLPVGLALVLGALGFAWRRRAS